MPLKSDNRSQLNLKGARITPDFLTLLRTAAGRQGQSVTDFVVDTMTAEAQRVVKGEAATGAAVPAKPDEVKDQLAALVEEKLARHAAEQDAKLAGIAAEVREQTGVFAEMRRAMRRGRWR